MQFTLEVDNAEHLGRALALLQDVKGVMAAGRRYRVGAPPINAP
jgi:hypothetical protein